MHSRGRKNRRARRLVRQLVVEQLRENPGATDQEIQDAVLDEVEGVLAREIDLEFWTQLIKFILELVRELRDLFND